jgi:hypothetical protein
VGWEDEYGSGTNFFVKTEQDGSVVVHDVNEEREQGCSPRCKGRVSVSAGRAQRSKLIGQPVDVLTWPN